MEQISDIRNVQTPLSLGSNGLNFPRALWKKRTSTKVRFTSTPRHPAVVDSLLQQRTNFQLLDSSYLDESLAESPILPVPSKVNLIFGRKQSLESDRRSISTSMIQTLGKIELCNNNNDSVQDNIQKGNIDKVKKMDVGECSSSIDTKEKFKKQLKQNKKNKAITPKKKSPKVYKIGLKKIVPELAAKKSAGSSKAVSTAAIAKKKSPKSKSPKTYKICPTKKVAGSVALTKKAKDPSKDEHVAGSSENYSESKQSHLKMSRCAKSPKLRTAQRALVKQHRDEIRREKEKLLELYKQKELEEQKRREEEEALKIRQQTVFRAHSIRKYAPLPNVKKRALTDPISPNLSKRRRIESSSQCSSNAGHSKT